ncbi:MAG TPA: hypothetical protein VI542_07785, partial [Candidatus Tectomicrobia bacterium]
MREPQVQRAGVLGDHPTRRGMVSPQRLGIHAGRAHGHAWQSGGWADGVRATRVAPTRIAGKPLTARCRTYKKFDTVFRAYYGEF